MKVKLIAQGIDDNTLEGALGAAAEGNQFDRLDVAVAYATKQGLRTLEGALGSFPPKSRWVIGLDDAITQPEALEYLATLPGATLRLASLAPSRRFHPKLYCLSCSGDDATRVSVIGSGNMTLNGLRRNGEVAVLLDAESTADARSLKGQWSVLWSLGKPATASTLNAYATVYAKAKKQRTKIVGLGVAPPEPHPDAPIPAILVGDPASAKHAWLDVGSATAQGREVELPRLMVPFFGVGSSTASPVYLKLRQKNRAVHTLALTMRDDNSMWRIGFTQAAINAGTGRNSLRPLTGGNRSDLAVSFTRTGKHEFDVSFVPLSSPAYNVLVANSKSADAFYRTRPTEAGRSFGFF